MPAPTKRVPTPLITEPDVRRWLEAARPGRGQYKLEPAADELARSLDAYLSQVIKSLWVLVEYDFRREAKHFAALSKAAMRYAQALALLPHVLQDVLAEDMGDKTGGLELLAHLSFAEKLAAKARERTETSLAKHNSQRMDLAPAEKLLMSTLVGRIADAFAKATGLPASARADGPACRFTMNLWKDISPYLPVSHRTLSKAAYRHRIMERRRQKLP